MMAAPDVVTPLEGIILEHMSTGGGATPRETPDLDQMMATRGVDVPAGGIVFGVVNWMVVVLRGSGVSPPAWTTVGFGGVVP
jgi:hypothetical protein